MPRLATRIPAACSHLDLCAPRINAEEMASDPVDASRPLLTLGRVDLVRVQVGFRTGPEDRAHQQFLLELSVPEAASAGGQGSFDERLVLAALEPVLLTGAGAPRHYSLHQHRWHRSWGASPSALELELVVTTGAVATAAASKSLEDGVILAFRSLMEVTGQPEPTSNARDAAILRAQHGVATAYAVAADALSLSVEEHHPADNSWTIGLRTAAGDEYDVVVGFVDGYAGSVRVRHDRRIEASDSIGNE